MNHAQAKAIIEAAFAKVHGRAPSELETLYCQAVAWLETHYGRGSGDPSKSQHARWASEGLFTWGNIERVPQGGECPWPSYYPGKDAGNDRCFLLRKSDQEAAEDLVRNLTKRHWPVLQAIENHGTPEAVAEAMKASPAYYEAPVSRYAAGLRNAITAIGKQVPVPAISTRPFPWVPLLAATALVGGLYFAHQRGYLQVPHIRLPRRIFG